nr:metallophosphoesterase [Wolbachia pipientis]
MFVRGNHESCNNAYEGWFKYLDPYPFSAEKCSDCVQSWFLDIGLMKFFVFDSSFGKDIYANKEAVSAFSMQFSRLINDDLTKPIWFLTHRPLWRSTKKALFTFKKHGNLPQIKAFGNRFPSNVAAIVSGHIHIAQILLMDKIPDQIIVGNGGALLHSQDQEPIYEDIEFDYSNSKHYLAREIKSFFGFGFAILDLDKHIFTYYNKDNDKIYSMHLNKDFKLID